LADYHQGKKESCGKRLRGRNPKKNKIVSLVGIGGSIGKSFASRVFCSLFESISVFKTLYYRVVSEEKRKNFFPSP
jgi:hypothetical protein